MKISIFGLGYVGCVSGACFAQIGHHVIGVDVNKVKVDLINSGKSPIIEKDVDRIIAKVVKSGAYSATTNSYRAIQETDIALVCVGTPSKNNGSIDTIHIKRVCKHIAEAMKARKGLSHHILVFS